MLITCPRYHEHRTNLQERSKSLLLKNEEHHELHTWQIMTESGRFEYVRETFGVRFPKKPEEPNPQPYYESRPPNPHRCWIETRT